MRAVLSLMVCLTATLAARSAFAQGPSATTTAQATTDIGTPASIGVIQNLTFSISPQSVGTGLVVTSSAANGVNANVVVGGAVGDTVSVSVPASISVLRDGGLETVVVRTVGAPTNVINAGGATTVAGIVSGGPFSTPVTVTGVLDAGMLSFSVGGQVTVANNLVPGDYHGVLTVVAQYN
jgi:hypothetical protein